MRRSLDLDLSTIHDVDDESNPFKRRGRRAKPAQQLPCPNCGITFRVTGNRIYCGGACSTQADSVRYSREQLRKYPANYLPSRIADVVERRQSFAMGPGGYHRDHVPLDLLAAVKLRDAAVCQMCGDPATDLDHINGDEASLENLRMLCSPCNQARADLRTRPAGPELQQLRDALNRRVQSKQPLRPCDVWNWDYAAYKRENISDLASPREVEGTRPRRGTVRPGPGSAPGMSATDGHRPIT